MSKGNDKKMRAGNSAPKRGISSYKIAMVTNKSAASSKPVMSQIGRKRP
jgi:hypothetical protein